MGEFKMGRIPHLKISLFFLIPLMMTGCIDENILKVSRDIEINPSYSLPLGPLAYDINEYLESLDTVSFPWQDSLFYNDTLYPNPLPYLVQYGINYFNFNSLISDISRVENIMFRLIVSNGYPTPAFTQVYFAEENQVPLDSAFADGPYELQPADTNADGVVTAPYEEIVDVPMSPNLIQNMGNIRYINIQSIIYTTRHDVPQVKFYSYYAYHINIAIRIQLRMNTGEL
jgi:hypothetical protein